MPNRFANFWRSLSDANQPRVRYLGRALLADLPVTVTVMLVLNAVTKTTPPTYPLESLGRVLLATCVFAPMAETFVMALLIWLLRRLVTRTESLLLITALICAGLHSLAKPLWGIEIFWAFWIFALCYTTWEKKSLLQAFWMTAILHALHNLAPTLYLAFTRTPL